ncbi:MAG TPA: sulfite exporter TauE/SafE family protein [Fibrobacteria bacterium]|nr:sulfite exporter TauE/SafE family protein [Fibrobacteria bacterium]
MTPFHALVLFSAGVLAGGLNALAGGGGFITLPAFIWSGSPPILANTNGTIAVWPGLLGALFAFRNRLQGRKHPLRLYLGMGVVGSAIGAGLLLVTSNSFFMALLPWLMLFATALFIAGKRMTDRLAAMRGDGEPFPKPVAWSLLFLIAVYGGYFGGGMGIMTLAVLTLIGMRDIHEMNALKSLLVAVINGIGVAIFVLSGRVEWGRTLVMTVGCAIGGYGAGYLSQKVHPVKLRRIIALIASGMTIFFFFRAYG